MKKELLMIVAMLLTLSSIMFGQTKTDTLAIAKSDYVKALNIFSDCEILEAKNQELSTKVETASKIITNKDLEILQQFQFGKKAVETIQELKKTIGLGATVIGSDAKTLEAEKAKTERLQKKLDKRMSFGIVAGYGITTASIINPQAFIGLGISYRIFRM